MVKVLNESYIDDKILKSVESVVQIKYKKESDQDIIAFYTGMENLKNKRYETIMIHFWMYIVYHIIDRSKTYIYTYHQTIDIIAAVYDISLELKKRIRFDVDSDEPFNIKVDKDQLRNILNSDKNVTNTQSFIYELLFAQVFNAICLEEIVHSYYFDKRSKTILAVAVPVSSDIFVHLPKPKNLDFVYIYFAQNDRKNYIFNRIILNILVNFPDPDENLLLIAVKYMESIDTSEVKLDRGRLAGLIRKILDISPKSVYTYQQNIQKLVTSEGNSYNYGMKPSLSLQENVMDTFNKLCENLKIENICRDNSAMSLRVLCEMRFHVDFTKIYELYRQRGTKNIYQVAPENVQNFKSLLVYVECALERLGLGNKSVDILKREYNVLNRSNNGQVVDIDELHVLGKYNYIELDSHLETMIDGIANVSSSARSTEHLLVRATKNLKKIEKKFWIHAIYSTSHSPVEKDRMVGIINSNQITENSEKLMNFIKNLKNRRLVQSLTVAESEVLADYTERYLKLWKELRPQLVKLIPKTMTYMIDQMLDQWVDTNNRFKLRHAMCDAPHFMRFVRMVIQGGDKSTAILYRQDMKKASMMGVVRNFSALYWMLVLPTTEITGDGADIIAKIDQTAEHARRHLRLVAHTNYIPLLKIYIDATIESMRTAQVNQIYVKNRGDYAIEYHAAASRKLKVFGGVENSEGTVAYFEAILDIVQRKGFSGLAFSLYDYHLCCESGHDATRDHMTLSSATTELLDQKLHLFDKYTKDTRSTMYKKLHKMCENWKKKFIMSPRTNHVAIMKMLQPLYGFGKIGDDYRNIHYNSTVLDAIQEDKSVIFDGMDITIRASLRASRDEELDLDFLSYLEDGELNTNTPEKLTTMENIKKRAYYIMDTHHMLQQLDKDTPLSDEDIREYINEEKIYNLYKKVASNMQNKKHKKVLQTNIYDAIDIKRTQTLRRYTDQHRALKYMQSRDEYKNEHYMYAIFLIVMNQNYNYVDSNM